MSLYIVPKQELYLPDIYIYICAYIYRMQNLFLQYGGRFKVSPEF